MRAEWWKFCVLKEALEKIADPRLRDHQEPDAYTQLGCVMNIASEALEAIQVLEKPNSSPGDTGNGEGPRDVQHSDLQVNPESANAIAAAQSQTVTLPDAWDQARAYVEAQDYLNDENRNAAGNGYLAGWRDRGEVAPAASDLTCDLKIIESKATYALGAGHRHSRDLLREILAIVDRCLLAIRPHNQRSEGNE